MAIVLNPIIVTPEKDVPKDYDGYIGGGFPPGDGSVDTIPDNKLLEASKRKALPEQQE